MTNASTKLPIIVIGLIMGSVIGYGGRILQANYGPRAELPELPEGPDLLSNSGQAGDTAVGFREFPIGDVDRNHMHIAAVWLPPIILEGQDPLTGEDVIHLEADVAATRGNPNGFGLGEWMPYLRIKYIIQDHRGKQVKEGILQAMVAADGPHYGTTLQMPGPGQYILSYFIEPPSASGFGRHCDRVTGVAKWWKAFKVQFKWNYRRP
jgi:periplasmic iron binding protein